MRHLSIRMAPDKGVWVNVPYGVSFREAEAFVRSQQEWIAERLRRVKAVERETAAGAEKCFIRTVLAPVF